MTITRTVVRTWLKTARLPITLAESTLHRGGSSEEWPPALAFGAFESGVKQVVAAPQQAARQLFAGQDRGGVRNVGHAPTIPGPAQSRKSSLIEVLDRVRSSTIFTITAQ